MELGERQRLALKAKRLHDCQYLDTPRSNVHVDENLSKSLPSRIYYPKSYLEQNSRRIVY